MSSWPNTVVEVQLALPSIKREAFQGETRHDAAIVNGQFLASLG